jgi:hypothetical protein
MKMHCDWNRPIGWKEIREVDENRRHTFAWKKTRPKSRAIYAPKRATIEKQKKKITLAKITLPEIMD